MNRNNILNYLIIFFILINAVCIDNKVAMKRLLLKNKIIFEETAKKVYYHENIDEIVVLDKYDYLINDIYICFNEEPIIEYRLHKDIIYNSEEEALKKYNLTKKEVIYYINNLKKIKMRGVSKRKYGVEFLYAGILGEGFGMLYCDRNINLSIKSNYIRLEPIDDKWFYYLLNKYR